MEFGIHRRALHLKCAYRRPSWHFGGQTLLRIAGFSTPGDKDGAYPTMVTVVHMN